MSSHSACKKSNNIDTLNTQKLEGRGNSRAVFEGVEASHTCVVATVGLRVLLSVLKGDMIRSISDGALLAGGAGLVHDSGQEQFNL